MKKKILVVEDDFSLATALKNKLSKEGFLVRVARNGKSGLEAFLRYKPDLVLLDIVMPVMDGMEMLRLLRLEPSGKEARVIVLTNLNDAGKTAQAVQRGVRDYLVKSDWKMADLIKKVKEKLK